MFTLLLCALKSTRNEKKKKIVLLCASYVFYMWWNPSFILLIIFSTFLDFIIGRAIYDPTSPSRKKMYLTISLIGNLGILAIFKYFNFFQANLLLALKLCGTDPGWTSLNIILPVGISFYTFQTMSYTIDVYRGRMEPSRSPLDFALFVAFFPQLVAGPIVRAADFLPQLKKPATLSITPTVFFLILRGLVKKVLIADNLAGFSDPVFSNPSTWPTPILFLATIAFSVQIYCDFSGYSDMAIGFARVLGYHLPLNFNKPYFALNPSDFWRRWHISLSTWLRDYLYISLGGSKCGTYKTYRNLMLTMLLGGLWHGASWNFVLWGFMHGLVLIAHRIFNSIRQLLLKEAAIFRTRGWSLISWVGMQYFVLLTWVTFRLTNTSDMLHVLKKLIFIDMDFSMRNIGLGSIGLFSSIALLLIFGILHTYSFFKGELNMLLGKTPLLIGCTASLLIGIGLVLLWPSSSPPFIYFQF